jgi:hypothetical protein
MPKWTLQYLNRVTNRVREIISTIYLSKLIILLLFAHALCDLIPISWSQSFDGDKTAISGRLSLPLDLGVCQRSLEDY